MARERRTPTPVGEHSIDAEIAVIKERLDRAEDDILRARDSLHALGNRVQTYTPLDDHRSTQEEIADVRAEVKELDGLMRQTRESVINSMSEARTTVKIVGWLVGAGLPVLLTIGEWLLHRIH